MAARKRPQAEGQRICLRLGRRTELQQDGARQLGAHLRVNNA